MERFFLKYFIIANFAIFVAFTSCSNDENEMTALGKKFMKEACDCFSIDDPENGFDCMEIVYEKYGKYFDNEDFVIATNNAPKCDEPAWWDGGGDFKTKLLDKIISDDGEFIEFEYDEQNRITNISMYYNGELSNSQTLTYGENEFIISYSHVDYPDDDYEEKYVIDGNTVTAVDDEYPFTITLNSSGYPIKIIESGENWSDETTYQYQGGNMIRWTRMETYNDEVELGYEAEFSYDNKKSPIYSCKSPKWFLLLWFIDSGIGVNNNITEWKEDGRERTTTYTYIFDSDGYPTRQIKTYTYEDGEGDDQTYITEFTYK